MPFFIGLALLGKQNKKQYRLEITYDFEQYDMDLSQLNGDLPRADYMNDLIDAFINQQGWFRSKMRFSCFRTT